MRRILRQAWCVLRGHVVLCIACDDGATVRCAVTGPTFCVTCSRSGSHVRVPFMNPLLLRPLALVLVLSLAASPAYAAEPICTIPSPPGRAVRLRLLGSGEGEGAAVGGYWHSDAMVQDIAKRIAECAKQRDGLVNELARCSVDRQIAAKKSAITWKGWSIIVGLAVTAGFTAGRLAR